ncbi:MAG: PepSY domain-containing protein [Oculatellaceae cyanobacterium bins.114]|nr:PepSY domain-containing protein [Oculatellaceae cyanobacterium bins.114]
MNRVFRKYHRSLALILSLPLLLTVLTGMGYVIFDEWLHMGKVGHFMIELHTMHLVGLETIYPLLTGLGLVGLLVTGANLLGWFRRRPNTPSEEANQ